LGFWGLGTATAGQRERDRGDGWTATALDS